MDDSNKSNIDQRLFKSISGLSDRQKEELLRFVNALQNERREHRRRTLTMEVHYTDQHRKSKGNIRNISRNGLFVEPNGPFAVGRIITLSFEHPNEKKNIQVSGKIVRKEPEGIGVHLTEPLNDL